MRRGTWRRVFAINVAEARKPLDAQRVAWRGRAFDKSKRLSAADIAEQARQTTALIERRRS